MTSSQMIESFEGASSAAEGDDQDESSAGSSSSSGSLQAKVDHNSVGGTGMALMPWFLYPPANN